MGGLGMIGTKPVYHAVMECDLLLMIGSDYPYSDYLPNIPKTIQIDERSEVLGRRTPTTLGILGSARPTLQLLLNQIKSKNSSSFFNKVTQEREKWDQMLTQQASLERSQDKIHPQAVARTVSDLADENAVFVFDTGLNTLWSGNWIRQKGTQRIIGSFNNAAVGTALAQANGIQALDRNRQVIALCGDGGFNMLMCEFLTASQHKLPVKVIIYNNSSFGLIALEAESTGLSPFREAIEFPNPDFVGFARVCGGHGFTAKTPGELKQAIKEALAIKGPAIVDARVVPDELPNVPHLNASLIEKVAIAKIKEAIKYVTGY
jgi:thiamine pyrophosphate-dependent acetolactate synthase large subunit-like protein